MIPGYRNFELLVRGGSADVYRAWQDSVGRYVAVKVLRPDGGGTSGERDRRDFAREQAVHTDLERRGAAVVPVIDARRTDDGRPCLVMRLYDGSVQQWLDEAASTLTVEQAVQILVPIAAALQTAHDGGVVHGDVKPENVLLLEQHSALGDFGSANVGATAPLPGQGTRLTPRHAAPEVLQSGTRTPSSDVWSLGSTLYRLLAPGSPFEPATSEPPAVFADRVRYDPVPRMLRPLDPALEDLLAAALAKDPTARPSAGEVCDGLEAVGREHPAPAPLRFASPATDVAPPPDAPRPGDVAGEPLPDPGETTDWQHEEEPPPDPAPPVGRRRPGLATVAVGVLAVVVGGGVALRLLGAGGGGGDGRAGADVTIPTSVAPAQDAPALGPSDVVVDDFGDTVDLRWTDNSDGGLTFAVIYQAPGEEQQIVEIDRGLTAVTIHDLDPDLGYCFRVLGVGVDGSGELVREWADAAIRGCEAQP